jgi:hypothetical protein
MDSLKKKDFNPENLANKAMKNSKILRDLINNLLIRDDTIRYNSHKVLLLVSENYPKALYPDWDFFVNLLKSENNFQRVIGIQILQRNVWS